MGFARPGVELVVGDLGEEKEGEGRLACVLGSGETELVREGAGCEVWIGVCLLVEGMLLEVR